MACARDVTELPAQRASLLLTAQDEASSVSQKARLLPLSRVPLGLTLPSGSLSCADSSLWHVLSANCHHLSNPTPPSRPNSNATF